MWIGVNLELYPISLTKCSQGTVLVVPSLGVVTSVDQQVTTAKVAVISPGRINIYALSYDSDRAIYSLLVCSIHPDWETTWATIYHFTREHLAERSGITYHQCYGREVVIRLVGDRVKLNLHINNW